MHEDINPAVKKRLRTLFWLYRITAVWCCVLFVITVRDAMNNKSFEFLVGYTLVIWFIHNLFKMAPYYRLEKLLRLSTRVEEDSRIIEAGF